MLPVRAARVPLRQQRHLEVLALGLCAFERGALSSGALGPCDFSVFFFSVEAPPTGNVVPGEVYIFLQKMVLDSLLLFKQGAIKEGEINNTSRDK